MGFVVSLEQPSVAVAGTDDRFPVRRIYCIGRNYLDHIRETAGADEREPPFFFQKPADAILPNGAEFPYPPQSENTHHEIELVVAIGKGGANIAPENALDHIFGYGVGIDMTRRDQQAKAKEMRRPWEIGKAFDHSAPCSAIVPVAQIGHLQSARIWIAVDGEVRQDGNIDQQIWSVPDALAHLSGLYELRPGDLMFTGTPAGVGSIQAGNVLTGGIEGIGEIKISVV